jgi:hypothetical protein
MVGRGAVCDPLLFRRIRAAFPAPGGGGGGGGDSTAGGWPFDEASVVCAFLERYARTGPDGAYGSADAYVSAALREPRAACARGRGRGRRMRLRRCWARFRPRYGGQPVASAPARGARPRGRTRSCQTRPRPRVRARTRPRRAERGRAGRAAQEGAPGRGAWARALIAGRLLVSARVAWVGIPRGACLLATPAPTPAAPTPAQTRSRSCRGALKPEPLLPPSLNPRSSSTCSAASPSCARPAARCCAPSRRRPARPRRCCPRRWAWCAATGARAARATRC